MVRYSKLAGMYHERTMKIEAVPLPMWDICMNPIGVALSADTEIASLAVLGLIGDDVAFQCIGADDV